jgi:hypothetical protein
VRQGSAQSSCTVAKKMFLHCQNLAPFPKLLCCSGLIFLVLTCQNKTAKKSYEPLLRILVRGSFSFVDLVEKIIRLISPPSYIISIVYFTVNLDPDLAILD